jgi:hypothetical protein
VHNPQTANNNIYSDYKIPQLDHFDIIEGRVTSKVTPPATVPADGITGYSDAYKCDSIATTKVIARFGKTAAGNDPNGIPTTLWVSEGSGYYKATLEITVPDGEKRYYRLRGTNIALSTPNEMDACGNPLPDTLMGTNTAAKAFDDLWFYSNPVFASNGFVGIKEVTDSNDNFKIYPNPANNMIYVVGDQIIEVKVYNIMGVLVKEQHHHSDSECKIDIHNLANGIYTVQIKTDSGNVVGKKFVKQ